MTLFGPIFAGFTEGVGAPISTATLLDLFSGPTHAGVRVTERSSLGMPAVWRAVNLIAGTIASLPLHAYERGGPESAVRVPATGPAADLLQDPHPDMTAFELWETVYAHQLLWGNAYLRILRDDVGRVKELWPVPPSEVQVGRESVAGKKLYVVNGDVVDGLPRVYDDDTMLHLPGFGYDGLCGVSPIRAARQGVSLALAAEEYGAKLFGSGSLATGILQTEQRLTTKQADSLASRWREKAGGLTSAHGTVVLDKGAKFHQLTIPPEDAQFLESRRFQISEIARMFGVPPHMLMDTEKSTSWGTGIEQQTIAFVVYTLRPWLTRVEQRVTRVLKPQKVYARYSLEGLLRGDSEQRANFYRAMWNLGVLSTNEIRAYEELAPVDGGDVRYRPLAMGELGTTDSTAADNPRDAGSTVEMNLTAEQLAKLRVGRHLDVEGMSNDA